MDFAGWTCGEVGVTGDGDCHWTLRKTNASSVGRLPTSSTLHNTPNYDGVIVYRTKRRNRLQTNHNIINDICLRNILYLL